MYIAEYKNNYISVKFYNASLSILGVGGVFFYVLFYICINYAVGMELN